jgi:hypothetical protein
MYIWAATGILVKLSKHFLLNSLTLLFFLMDRMNVYVKDTVNHVCKKIDTVALV